MSRWGGWKVYKTRACASYLDTLKTWHVKRCFTSLIFLSWKKNTILLTKSLPENCQWRHHLKQQSTDSCSLPCLKTSVHYSWGRLHVFWQLTCAARFTSSMSWIVPLLIMPWLLTTVHNHPSITEQPTVEVRSGFQHHLQLPWGVKEITHVTTWFHQLPSYCIMTSRLEFESKQ